MVCVVKNHKIGICEQNLRTETCEVSYMASLGGYPSETITLFLEFENCAICYGIGYCIYVSKVVVMG